MHPFSAIARRVLMAGSLVVLPMLTACSGSITEPVAKQSGYLTVSAAVSSQKPVPSSNTGSTVNSTNSGPGGLKLPENTVSSGYNVTAY